MKLEAGKRYVRRDKSITPPLVLDPWGWVDVFVDPITELVYLSDEDSEVNYVFSFRKNPADLMREYEEEV